MSNHWILLVFTIDLFLGYLIKPILCVNGCITVQIESGKQTICLSRHNFTRVPPKLPKELTILEIKNQKIRSLTSEQLMGIPMLQQLTMDSNQISSIAEDTFRYVPQLRNLSLCNNMLILGGNAFPSAALLYLKQLVSLDLQRNPLNFVPDFFFQPLRNLKRLLLSRAPAGFKIRPSGLAGLTNLEVLDLSFCNLTSLTSDSLEKALLSMQLRTLHLHGNPWRCDCRIKWLHQWLNPTSSRTAGGSANDVPNAATIQLFKVYKKSNGQYGVLQPQCAYPRKLYKSNIFRIQLSAGLRHQESLVSNVLTRYEHLTANDLVCPPRVVWRSRSTRIDRGRNLTLACGFEADPAAQVQWSKNGMIVGKHWTRITFGTSSSSSFSLDTTLATVPQNLLDDKYRFVAWLRISPAKLDDTGMWRCLLATGIGKANTSFQVRIKHTSPPPLDLSIILKYIGIGAVTLILFLVVIGIAIYCVYGFKFRSFNSSATSTSKHHHRHHHQHQASSMSNNNTSSNNNNGGPSSCNIRPQLIVDKPPIQVDPLAQKCMLLPNSPTMILPSNGGADNILQPCPLHGPIANSAATAATNNTNSGLPHTLPRHKHHQCHSNHDNHHHHHHHHNQPGSPLPPCPLHGHLIPTHTHIHQSPPLAPNNNSQDNTQDNNNNEDPNLNSIYSFFFSPRHSQPIINSHNPHTPTPNTQFIPNHHPHHHHQQQQHQSMTTSMINPATSSSNNRPSHHSAGHIHIVSSGRTNSNNNEAIVKLHDEEEYVF